MKRSILHVFFCLLISSNAFAQNGTMKVTEIKAKANATVSYQGNLSDGQQISDLSWAANSSVACFPATQNKKYTGNHVLYSTTIPKRSEMFIKVIPKNKNQNFSLYAYQVGLTNEQLPPNLSSCVTCEADHKWDRNWRGKTQDHTRTVRVNAINRPYKIVIGVVGAEGLMEGDFTIEIKVNGGEETPKLTSNKIEFTEIKAKANATVSYQGNLSEGQQISDLSWASNSSVACFPATQNKKYTGNHVLYSTTIPKRSEMFIKVIPKNKNQNFSIYAYQVGLTNEQLPPNLSSCITCEADHKWDRNWRGKTQDHTRTVRVNAINRPYKIVIGVVGAEGLTEGDFTIEIKVNGGEETPALTSKVEVTKIETKGAVTTINGNLNKGGLMHDLSWASNSSVACFPATQNKKYRGNHVLYSTTIPKYSEMFIKVIPKNKKDNFSLYVYQVGLNNEQLPPKLSSCITCEADHKWDRNWRGKTQDHTRKVRVNAINRPYKIVIGVVGAEGLTEGDFELEIEIKKR